MRNADLEIRRQRSDDRNVDCGFGIAECGFRCKPQLFVISYLLLV
ncbi:hypothetical protein D1AOALGA4SA_7786 [Olavius algarvensis Delta 1 endosymbiont]|nr:hypothetical protein D1AOALGA4SA_7786 [Olavius algarvensis Delta 1 endosymbiont]